MNKIWVGCVLTSLFTPLANAQAPLSLEERLAQMEQRLKATEQRAASAEAEIRALKGQERQRRWSAPHRLNRLYSLMIMAN
jgi:septal ring factor EnvC (AmiA/AmiB activator)